MNERMNGPMENVEIIIKSHRDRVISTNDSNTVDEDLPNNKNLHHLQESRDLRNK